MIYLIKRKRQFLIPFIIIILIYFFPNISIAFNETDLLPEGIRLYKNGSYTQAIDVFQKVIQSKPKPPKKISAEAHFFIGESYLAKYFISKNSKLLDKSVSAYIMSRDLQPQKSKYEFALSSAYALQGNLKAANASRKSANDKNDAEVDEALKCIEKRLDEIEKKLGIKEKNCWD